MEIQPGNGQKISIYKTNEPPEKKEKATQARISRSAVPGDRVEISAKAVNAWQSKQDNASFLNLAQNQLETPSRGEYLNEIKERIQNKTYENSDQYQSLAATFLSTWSDNESS